MKRFVDSPYLVPFDGSFRISRAPTAPPKKFALDEAEVRERLAEQVEQKQKLQRKLAATDAWSLLLIFQAMDAAGKDGTIRAVMSGIDPSGCQVYAFKQPSHEDLDHDFLWRTARCLPERGRIGIFNRSYYEEVLIVRVHPEYLDRQRLPERPKKLDTLFEERFESIRDHEKHLARSGTVIVKFFLHVSKDEQKKRFLDRIEDVDANWKFGEADVVERGYFDAYQRAYQDALNETSRPWAPWYAVPADDKSFMRLTVSDIVLDTLRGLELAYPRTGDEERARLAKAKALLLSETKPAKKKK